MRSRILLLAAAMLFAALPQPAGAAGSIEFYEVQRSGNTVTATGAAVFAAQPNVPLGTDPIDDAPTGFKELGGDVTSIGMYTMPSGEVIARVGFVNVMVAYSTPVITYGWTFCVDGDRCYELQTQRFPLGITDPFPASSQSVLYRCATPACEPSALTLVQTGGIDAFFSPHNYVVTVPPAAEVGPGSTISGATGGRVAFSDLGSADPMTLQRDTGDSLATMAPYTVPRKEVSLVVARRGEDPIGLTYGPGVEPDADGFWTAPLDVTDLRGPHTVYARACLGAGNCAYATYDINL